MTVTEAIRRAAASGVWGRSLVKRYPFVVQSRRGARSVRGHCWEADKADTFTAGIAGLLKRDGVQTLLSSLWQIPLSSL